MIVFQNPVALALALCVPALYVLRALGVFTRISFPLTFADWGGRAFSYRGRISRAVSVLSEFLLAAAFLALVVACADPVVHHQEKIYTSKGTDVLFVLDTSPSMAARDIAYLNETLTRLDAAKLGITTLVRNEPGASFGLVAMAREAAVLVPPTSDRDFFASALDGIAVGTLGDGTAIGTGLCSAVYHLAASRAPKKCIVLITDGENNAGSVHPETAAALAAQNGITLYTFGIGTRGSAPIEYVDPATGQVRSGYYESDFDPAPLEAVAAGAGGRYFGVESLGALSDALSSVARRESAVQSFRLRTVDTHCYDRVLALALVLAAAAWVLRRVLLSEVL